MSRTIYPLDYVLKLLLEGRVQEGTQALSDYVEDMKEKRGRAGRAGDKDKKAKAAKARWEARLKDEIAASIERTKPKHAVTLPPGVKLGSELEARE